MKRGISIEHRYDWCDRLCVVIKKKRGKLTFSEIEEILRYEDQQRWNGQYIIFLNCAESTLGGDGWLNSFEEEKGDEVSLYELEDAGKCPVCSSVLPPFQYCPNCGTKWSDMDSTIETRLASMRSEAERCIKDPKSSYDARVAWYWTHIGALDLARQMDWITEERRQELYHEFAHLKPRREQCDIED